MALSPTDMKILKLLQDDARVTNQVLAEKLACPRRHAGEKYASWKRMK